MAKVDIIALQLVDFENSEKQRIQGMNVWYLEPFQNTATVVGTLPRKKWLSADFLARNPVNEVGTYEFETDLSGKISGLHKIK